MVVKDFATLTGDFHSLSATDLKIIALAHSLLVERGEAGDLREKPSELTAKKIEDNEKEKPEEAEDTEKMEEMEEVKEERKSKRRQAQEMAEDDSAAWITPDNISKGIYFGKERLDTEIKEDTTKPKKSVGIVTSDFSMQNVIMQIGIPLYSADGAVISQVKQFVLRCRACLEYFIHLQYRVNKESKTGFCSGCGNYGLEKVVVKLGSDGNVRYGNFRRNINLRGTIVTHINKIVPYTKDKS